MSNFQNSLSVAIICYLAIQLLITHFVSAHDYCANDANHLLCVKEVPDMSLAKGPCRLIRPYNVTDKDQKELLNFFNQYRKEVAHGNNLYMTPNKNLPTASDMNQLVWSDTLGNAAQKAAETCGYMTSTMSKCSICRQFGKLQAEIITINHSEIPITLNYKRELKKQGQFFKSDLIESYNVDEKYFFFTLMTNAKTRYIGCGRVSAPEFKDACVSTGNFVMEICLLTATENAEVEKEVISSESTPNKLFKVGKPCTECPKYFDCGSGAYTGLCTGNKNTKGILDEEEEASTKLQLPEVSFENYNYCEFHPDHIMCETRNPCHFPNEIYSKTVRSLKMTQVDKDEMLNYLNFFRSKIARNSKVFGSQTIEFPSAADMIKVEWSDELEKAATNYAKCDDFHETCPQCFMFDNEVPTDSILFEHHRIPPNQTYIHYLTSAFEKYQAKHGKPVLNSFAAKDIVSSHFELFVYSKITYIGCGRVTPSPMNRGGSCAGKPFAFERCLTYPSVYANQNMEFQEDNVVNLYTEGKICSKCPEGFECWQCPKGEICKTVKNFKGLCQNKDPNHKGTVIPKSRPKNPATMRPTTTTIEATELPTTASAATLETIETQPDIKAGESTVTQKADTVTQVSDINATQFETDESENGSGENDLENDESDLGSGENDMGSGDSNLGNFIEIDGEGNATGFDENDFGSGENDTGSGEEDTESGENKLAITGNNSIIGDGNKIGVTDNYFETTGSEITFWISTDITEVVSSDTNSSSSYTDSTNSETSLTIESEMEEGLVIILAEEEFDSEIQTTKTTKNTNKTSETADVTTGLNSTISHKENSGRNEVNKLVYLVDRSMIEDINETKDDELSRTWLAGRMAEFPEPRSDDEYEEKDEDEADSIEEDDGSPFDIESSPIPSTEETSVAETPHSSLFLFVVTLYVFIKLFNK